MTSTSPNELAGRLWSLCNVLRDDGIVYHKYLSELTYLLFLKNARQIGAEENIPVGCRWNDLLEARGHGMLGVYRKMLTSLGEDVDDDSIRRIFSFPTTVFSHDENLEKVVNGIEEINWHNHDRDSLGIIYESLLERNATEARSGSGQYFTPRALVNSMVRVMQPAAGETVLDPAAGTGGFLIAAHAAGVEEKSKPRRYLGVEIERDTFRLCLMNLFLHGMDGDIVHGDALTEDSSELGLADLVLANPPFGVSAGGARPRRGDIPFPTANKQLAFLQYIGMALAAGGRAAVVVPDNVLTEGGAGRQVRKALVDEYDLHTVLRLPRGIFYAPGVQTNVLFFNKPDEEARTTSEVWFYDLRSNMPKFTKRKILQEADFRDFETVFGTDPWGHSPRNSSPRFARLSLEEIRERDHDLDFRGSGEDTAPEDPDVAELLMQMETAIEAATLAVAEIHASIRGLEESPT